MEGVMTEQGMERVLVIGGLTLADALVRAGIGRRTYGVAR
jgi:hypothetical protein